MFFFEFDHVMKIMSLISEIVSTIIYLHWTCYQDHYGANPAENRWDEKGLANCST
jgi:hypothetical protein